MNEQNALATLFEGKEIRAIEQEGDIWFPVIDLANAWGTHRNTLRAHLDSDEGEKFKGFTTTGAQITCASGLPLVNEKGLYLLMGSVCTKRLKNRESAKAILRFQRWVPELIQKYRKKEIVQSQLPAPDPVAKSLLEKSEYRKILIENYEFDPKEATMICLGIVQKDTGVSFHKPAVISHSESGWMNPMEIGMECGLTAREVNSWLYNKKFQYPEGPAGYQIWRLTDTGEKYGQEYEFNLTNKHSEIRIRWSREVMIASGLKKPAGQSAIIVAES